MEPCLRPPPISWGRTAWYGAEAALALVFAYALAFLGYAGLRASITILATPDIDGGLAGTLLATWVSLALPSFVVAALFTFVAVPLGAATALAIRMLLVMLHIIHKPGQAALAGALLCLTVSLVLVGLLNRSLGVAWSPVSAESLTFWLLLPLLVYTVAGGAASWQVSKGLGRSAGFSGRSD
jgi:hypothetical protein